MTATLAYNKYKKRGVFIQSEKISELDFFIDLVKEVQRQRSARLTQEDTLRFFQEVSGLVAEGFVEEDPEYVEWAVESAGTAMRIAVEVL